MVWLTTLVACSPSLAAPAQTNAPGKSAAIVQNGTADLRAADFSRGPIDLQGQWHFLPGELVPPGQTESRSFGLLQTPGLWNGYKMPGGGELLGQGCATYRLKLLLPQDVPALSFRMADAATAYRLFLNGKEVMSNGNPSCDPARATAQYLPTIATPATLAGQSEVVVHVSNYVHTKGGLWEVLQIGVAAQLYAVRERTLWTDFFLTGAFLIMGLYHLGLYLLRRKDLSSLYFGLTCFVVTARLLVTGERLWFQVWPDFPFWLGQKVEYLSAFWATPVFTLFFWASFKEDTHRLVVYCTLALYSVLTVLVIAGPLAVYSRALPVFFGSSLLLSVYGIVILILAIRRGRDGALAALLGFSFFVGTVVNDILASEFVLNTPLLLPVGLFAFIFSQSFMLSMRFSMAYSSVESLSVGLKQMTEDLLETNRAYSRFVPTEFLNLLQKDTIRDIRLGDQVQREMTVLFSDIIAFTEISERLTPKENFDFLNSYLKRMQPAIDSNAGFVDKYIGDSIMALFPNQAVDAVRAAVAMQAEMREYNRHRLNHGYTPVGVRIGIHTGLLMLGTIGSAERMEGTVISDSVNLASRIEGLNRRFGTFTLISQQTRSNIANPDEFQMRRLGRVQVKGKRENVSVYEVFNGLTPVLIEQLVQSRSRFEAGLSAFEVGDFAAATEHFNSVLQIHPGDEATRIYLSECGKRSAG